MIPQSPPIYALAPSTVVPALRKVRRRCLFEPTWRPVVPRLAGRAHFVLWKHEKNRSHPRPNPHPSRPRAPQVRGNRLDSLQCKITLRPLSTFCNGLKQYSTELRLLPRMRSLNQKVKFGTRLSDSLLSMNIFSHMDKVSKCGLSEMFYSQNTYSDGTYSVAYFLLAVFALLEFFIFLLKQLQSQFSCKAHNVYIKIIFF